jgi:arylsulfatase A-like enzyme
MRLKLFKMKNQSLIIALFFLASCNPGTNDPNKNETPQAKPNFVILFADDLGYGDLSCYGNPIIKTPNIDNLASQGMRLTSFYMAESICTPSRAALLTGRYPFRSGLEFVLGPDSEKGIPDAEFTLAEGLKTKGYATAIYGKWHLGHKNETLPTYHGFDEYFGIPYSNDMMPPWVQTETPLSLWENTEPVEHPVDQDYITQRYTQRAVDFIKQNKNNPFFLYLPYNMPHMPVNTSVEFRGKSRGGLYGDVIETIDWSVGEVLKTLKEEGLDENTFVIFSSDNGPWAEVPPRMVANGNERHHAGNAGLLRGSKASKFDGGFRVPGIFRFPGRIPAGQVSADMATSMDIYTTIMNIAEVELPQELVFDGHDMLAFLEGKSDTPRDEFYFILAQRIRGVRKGPWKLLIKNEGTIRIEHSDLENAELYNLDLDPGERYDFSDKEPGIVEELKQLIAKFDLQMLNESLKRQANP